MRRIKFRVTPASIRKKHQDMFDRWWSQFDYGFYCSRTWFYIPMLRRWVKYSRGLSKGASLGPKKRRWMHLV